MSAPHPRTAHAGRDVRILRAAVFAAVCVVLAAVGHALGSCTSIPLWTLGAGFLAILAVAVPLAGRERTLPGIAVLLALGQTVLHSLFGLGQHGAEATRAAASADATLVAQAARILCGTRAAAISPAEAHRILTEARLRPASAHPQHPETVTESASLLPSLPMLLGHLLAAVVAGYLLRRGDIALGRLVELSAHSVAEAALVRSLRAALALVRALRAGLPGTPGAAPRPHRTAEGAPPRLHEAALQHTLVRRGPPAAAPALVLAA
ncbi:hypothetical protein [Streptomyces sp. NPDC003635]